MEVGLVGFGGSYVRRMSMYVQFSVFVTHFADLRPQIEIDACHIRLLAVQISQYAIVRHGKVDKNILLILCGKISNF